MIKFILILAVYNGAFTQIEFVGTDAIDRCNREKKIAVAELNALGNNNIRGTCIRVSP